MRHKSGTRNRELKAKKPAGLLVVLGALLTWRADIWWDLRGVRMMAHVRARKRKASQTGTCRSSSNGIGDENGLDAEWRKDSCDDSMCVEG